MRPVCLGLLTLTLVSALLGQELVTATRKVRVGANQTSTIRQINGRWWTLDNRMVNMKAVGGMSVDSNRGVTQFFHHRPFDLRLAERLRLFMTPYEVIVTIGYPNRVFHTGSGDLCEACIPNEGFWWYYAPDGTMLEIRMMDAELGEAEYEPLEGSSKSVASIARDLNGQSIFSLRADRASERIRANGGISAPDRVLPALIRYPVVSATAAK